MATKLDIKMNQSIIPLLGRKLYQSGYSMVVLRELIQNSLDAQAIQIDVEFLNNVLTVKDNGTGIQKIEGLLDTVGASIKADSLDKIGGYGLAKLAIFSAESWKFTSISGSFETGFIFNPDEKIPSGTIVTIRFNQDDIFWGFDSQVKNYLQSINRNCQITFNGSVINPPTYNTVNFGNHNETISKDLNQYEGKILVRVNGLPTFSEYVNNLKGTIILDYPVNCDPYDEKYPLTSNRDSFIQSSAEYNDYKSRKQVIETKLESDKKLAENIAKKEKSTVWRNKQYISYGNVTKQDYEDNSIEISTYARYITQIAKIARYDVSNCNFGLSDGSQESGLFSPDDNCFAIAKGISNKGKILAIALHEYTHFVGYGRHGHDQDFASYLTSLTGKVLSEILAGDFRK